MDANYYNGDPDRDSTPPRCAEPRCDQDAACPICETCARHCQLADEELDDDEAAAHWR